MKYLFKYLFLIISIYFINLNNCQNCPIPIATIYKEKSCAGSPSKLIIVNADYYSFDYINITPSIIPLIDIGVIGNITYNLQDGISYVLSYTKKGCTGIIQEEYTPIGMYYSISNQPKCLYSNGQVTFYNDLFNGSSTVLDIQQAGVQYQHYNSDGQCAIYYTVTPKDVTNVPNLKTSNPMCGFSNGTISVGQNSFGNVYTSIGLFVNYNSGSQITIQPTGSSKNEYSGLDKGVYTLVLKSEACDTEVITITLQYVYSQILLDLKEVPNFHQNSTMTFSFENNLFNSSSVGIYFPNTNTLVPANQWVDYQSLLINGFTYFGYYYNTGLSSVPTSKDVAQCISTEFISTQNIRPNVGVVITKSNSSCLSNVTVTINSNYKDDVITFLNPSTGYVLDENNQFSAPYNLEFQLYSRMNENPFNFNTMYTTLDYIITESKSGQPDDCWKLYDIKINNYASLKTLKLVVNSRNAEYTIYPVNGVFSNVASNYFKIRYTPSDCQDEQTVYVDKRSNNSPFDSCSIGYEVVVPGSCESDAIIKYTITTPIGNTTGNFTNNPQFVSIPYSWCYCSLIDYVNPTVSQSTKELTINSSSITPICKYSGAFVEIDQPTGYNMNNILVNGEIVIPVDNLYNIPSGEQVNITAQLSYGNRQCSSTKMITIEPSTKFTVNYTVTPSTSCTTGTGVIQILDYSNFDTLFAKFGNDEFSSINGKFENLVNGLYTIHFTSSLSSSCNGSIDILVGSEISSYEISNTPIRNPSCSNSYGYADGLVQISLKINGNQQTNFTIMDNSKQFTFSNGVYQIANSGSNKIIVSSGYCTWDYEFEIEMKDPGFKLVPFYNSSICLVGNIFKVVSSYPDSIVIEEVNYVGFASFYYYQNNYYIYNTNPGVPYVSYTVFWNSYCSKSVTSNVERVSSNPMNYEMIRPTSCNTFSIDIKITNYDSFVSGSVLINGKQPVQQASNSSIAIFKNLIPNASYSISYRLLNGCTGTVYTPSYYTTGYVDSNITLITTNDICSKKNGKLTISNFDSTNYYYVVTYNLNSNGEIDYLVNSDGILENLPYANYLVTRYSKSFANCRTSNSFTISQGTPMIESISTTDSYDNLNNGTVVLTLNFNPSNVKYEITSQSSTSSSFSNLAPSTYTIKVIISDEFCPTTLQETFTIKQLLAPKDSSDNNTPSTSSTLFKPNYIVVSIILLIIFSLQF